jgi:hypothetical protein
MTVKNLTQKVNLSRDEFIRSIHSSLCKHGLSEVVKAELRHGVILALKSSSEENGAFQSFRNHSSSSKSYDVYDLAINSLVHDHLEYMGLYKSMSVFLPECGLNENVVLSWEHALKVLFPLYDSAVLIRQNKNVNKSKLFLLLSSLSSIDTDNNISLEGTKRCIASVQTDDELEQEKNGLFTARVQLDRQLKDIESKYLNPNIVDTIEERVQHIRFEYDRKLKQQLLCEMEKYKDECLSKIKAEQLCKSQKEVDNIHANIRTEYEFRLQREKETFEKRLGRMAFEKELMDMENHNSRKHLIAEMENLKRIESERIKSLDIQKQEMELEMNKMRQQMRRAQERCEICEAKESDIKLWASNEYKRAYAEATRNYLAATDAVQRQCEFYNRELSELTSKYLLSENKSRDYSDVKMCCKNVFITFRTA